MFCTYGEWSEAIMGAAEQVVGHTQSIAKPPWMVDNQLRIRELAEEKRKAFNSGNRELYKRVRNKSRSEMRKMLNSWWRQQAEEIQRAADRHDHRGVFEGSRTLGR
eukprot:6529795-Karenia_brevis.AAC.1